MPTFRKNSTEIVLKDVHHLLLPDGVRNDLELISPNHFLFVTGPNMSGKSTYLKACGLAVYLAHLGMGVPAEQAELPVFDDIFTDLYLTDDINLGYSYFYSEIIMRIKKLVEHLQAGERMFAVIDEMFRGTNVQDAYDCSLTVIKNLQYWRESFFILSSHMAELTDKLRPKSNIQFCCFEGVVRRNKPVFN
jgi:DNA mismatch repair ATPase MutS